MSLVPVPVPACSTSVLVELVDPIVIPWTAPPLPTAIVWATALVPILILVAFVLPSATVPPEPESSVSVLDAAVGPTVKTPLLVLQVGVPCAVIVSACAAAG